MKSKLTLTTVPAITPITLQQAKDQCRIDTTAEDDYLTALIKEATDYIQQKSNLQLITATYKQYLDEFPTNDKAIQLACAPLQSITSITYVDADGVTQTWAAAKYEADQRKIPGEVRPIESESYPDTKDVVNAVIITFKSGFGDASTDVPDNILRAVKLLVNFWFDKRLTVTAAAQDIDIPIAVRSLLNLNALHGFN